MKTKQLIFLLVIFLPSIVLAQFQVSGTVLDDQQIPLPGVSVVEKGTTNGVSTDFDGNYTIKVGSETATLVFSYIGFLKQEKAITSNTLNIEMVPDVQQLNEVVVIGYGEVLKKDLTGSVSSVEPSESQLAQTTNVQNLIQGRAAGVVVSNNGTEPGAPSSIKIRGTNSLTGNTEPLYVIDGIIVDSATEDTLDPLSGGNSYLAPQQGINGINPRDIEDIQILKDASATAIYGSRGSNGVVLITTKRGRSGKAKFNFAAASGIGTITNNIEVLGADQYVEYQNRKQELNGQNPAFYTYGDRSIASFQTDAAFMEANSGTIPRLNPVNWSEDVYRPSINSNYRISASGGAENGNYYIAGGFTDNKGIVPRSFAKKSDFVVNLNQDLTERLELGTKISTTYIENSASKGTEDLGGANNNLIRQIISGAPLLGFNENNFGNDFEETIDGPRAWISDYDDFSNELRILGSVKLQYKISDAFTYQLLLGGDYRKKQRQIWYGTGVFRGATVNGEAGLSVLDRFRYNIDNTVRFRKNFNKNHRINGTVGVIFDQSNIQQTTNQAADFANQDLRADGISYGQVFQPVFFNKEKETIFSFLGRFNYTLKNKYLLTATFRADGSSKFTKDNRFSYFPSLALAWKVDEEKFLSDSKTISEFKLRAGWGKTGNQGIPNYRTLTPFGPTFTPLSDGSGGGLTSLVPTNLANTDLRWETTSQYNAGIDLGFFNDRISATVDVYYKEISDLLLNVEIGPSAGFSSYFANQGDITNQGLEISLNADVLDGKFKWNVFGNIAFNRNEIQNLGIPPAPFGTETYSAFLGRQISGGNYFKTPANIFIEGQPAALFYGIATNGIISNDDELSASPSFRGAQPQLGDVRLVDQNGDNNIDDSDLTIIGDPNPDFNYGFGTSFEYGGVSLSLLFNGIYGNEIANGSSLRDAYADNSSLNIRTEAYVNAWSAENPNGTYPRVGYDLQDETGFTDRIVEDGSFLRLSNVNFTYSLPTENIKGLDGASVSISGQNLWLWTNYSGFDPEVNSFSFDPGRVGIDWNSFPNAKTITLGLNVSF